MCQTHHLQILGSFDRSILRWTQNVYIVTNERYSLSTCFFLFFVFCFWSPARFRHLLIHEKKGKKFLCRMDGTLTHSPTHNFL